MYDIRDLLDKAVAITDKKIGLYEQLLTTTTEVQLKALIRVMIHSAQRDKHYYLGLKAPISDADAQEIDFGTYDMIASLINQFTRNFQPPQIQSCTELVQFALNFEKSLYALMVDIQGRLVHSEGLSASITYRTLGKMVHQKSSVITTLEHFAKVNP